MGGCASATMRPISKDCEECKVMISFGQNPRTQHYDASRHSDACKTKHHLIIAKRTAKES